MVWNRYLSDFVKQYWVFQTHSDGNKTSVAFSAEIRKTLMFSFGEAVILTGMDSGPPECQSELWVQTDAESSGENPAGRAPFLLKLWPEAHPGSHLAQSTEPALSQEHSCALPSLPLDFLFAAQLHVRRIPSGFEYDSPAKHQAIIGGGNFTS